MNQHELIKHIQAFLAEDIGQGDITSEAIFTHDQLAHARFIAKEPFITCGLEKVALQVFKTQNPDIISTFILPDGTHVQQDDVLLALTGPLLDLLAAERVALNLVQRLCGITTNTSKFVEKVKDLSVRIVDTRKTTPGLRMLEKYAVRVGGGFNHRFNLADAVLIKDNHIIASGSIAEAVDKIRNNIPHTMKIEVEAETLLQVEECLVSKVDTIMLDNMDMNTMQEAVKMVNGKALVEASGGITLENVRQVAETGVDIISIGALTHSVTACDISMQITAKN